MELHKQTAWQLLERLKKKEVTVMDICTCLYAQIEKQEQKIRAFVTLTKDIAMSMAQKSDKILSENKNVPENFFPLPVALKDNLCTKGTPTTCSSKILKNYTPPYDATVVEKLRNAGAPFLGKANMDEFAMGSSTENSGLFITRNPKNTDCVPGGSSGGSCAAVASDMALWALGSDTGGSIRQPASFCGVVGLKPTYGRVSRFGLVAFASSLDQIGPITKDVRDSALLLNIISGHDAKDTTSCNLPVPDYTQALGQDIKGLKIGLPKEFFPKGLDAAIETSIKHAAKIYENLGARIVEVSLPHLDYALPVYYIIAPAEASSNLARYDGVQYGLREKSDDLISMYKQTREAGFGQEVKRRIMLGTYALSAGYYDAYYLKALKVRTLIKQDFDHAFETCDIIIGPTTPTVAFKFGEHTSDPLSMYLSDIFTIPVNLAGLPGMSIPCGEHNGLPIGLQLIAKTFDEETLLRTAYAFEQSTK